MLVWAWPVLVLMLVLVLGWRMQVRLLPVVQVWTVLVQVLVLVWPVQARPAPSGVPVGAPAARPAAGAPCPTFKGPPGGLPPWVTGLALPAQSGGAEPFGAAAEPL